MGIWTVLDLDPGSLNPGDVSVWMAGREQRLLWQCFDPVGW